MDPEWRKFEKLIARIEHALSPSGAIVKSPDFILDKATGEQREVDASIRYTIGSTSILITIECRRRGSSQDVTWIEQLIRKKSDIGAAVTIAVSLKGFSKAAIKKAAVYGIEVRRLDQLTSEDVIQWLRIQFVQVKEDVWSLKDLALELYDVPENVELSQELQGLFQAQGPEAEIFIRNSDSKQYSVRNILIEWEKRNGGIFVGIPPDGTAVE